MKGKLLITASAVLILVRMITTNSLVDTASAHTYEESKSNIELGYLKSLMLIKTLYYNNLDSLPVVTYV